MKWKNEIIKLKKKNSLITIKNKNQVIDWKNAIEQKVLRGNYKYKNLYVRLQRYYRYIGKN